MHKVSTSKAIFIYGPQGCGKTRNAAALCRHYGKREAIEHDEHGRALRDYPTDVIVFFNIKVPGAIPFEKAAREARIRETGTRRPLHLLEAELVQLRKQFPGTSDAALVALAKARITSTRANKGSK